jgi:hypothetical protein
MQFLRQRGLQGLEAFFLWAGVRDESTFTVTHTIAPAQTGHVTDDGVCVTVGPDELHRINVWLYDHKLSLIAQIHSHPTEAYHSGTDDEFPIATTLGCISIVIPDFACQPFSLSHCAIYRLNQYREWAYLEGLQASHLITIIE